MQISTRRLLTEEEARQVEAALKLAGLTRRAFAKRAGLGYSTLTKTISRQRTPTQAGAAALEDLLNGTRWPAPGPESTE